jgi:DNA-binding NarL/FixJ family response regulator
MKVLLLDDHSLFRAGLRLLLKTLEPKAITFEAGTIDEALDLAGKHTDLSLCLLDINLRNENGLDALAKLKTIVPDLAVVVVSASEESALIRECIHAGAMSYIPKSAEPEILSEALKSVLVGKIYIPPQIMDDAPAGLQQTVTISPRQIDVLRCLCRGMPTKSIAKELVLSEHTIKEHINNLFQILNVHNRTEAVIKAAQLQLLSDWGQS